MKFWSTFCPPVCCFILSRRDRETAETVMRGVDGIELDKCGLHSFRDGLFLFKISQ
jgi:hypothetical protein